MKSHWTRREFLQSTTAAVVLGATEKAIGAAASSLPKRRLGKTAEMISCIGLLRTSFDMSSRSLMPRKGVKRFLPRNLALLRVASRRS